MTGKRSPRVSLLIEDPFHHHIQNSHDHHHHHFNNIGDHFRYYRHNSSPAHLPTLKNDSGFKGSVPFVGSLIYYQDKQHTPAHKNLKSYLHHGKTKPIIQYSSESNSSSSSSSSSGSSLSSSNKQAQTGHTADNFDSSVENLVDKFKDYKLDKSVINHRDLQDKGDSCTESDNSQSPWLSTDGEFSFQDSPSSSSIYNEDETNHQSIFDFVNSKIEHQRRASYPCFYSKKNKTPSHDGTPIEKKKSYT
ncbi:hypothetical protein DAMA08_049790 [Martiniozyma asiatica (nom. inval.)]|nr:hypothetical protein DAMA08_049790 [Martiniozyma asiatica]